jgi:2'-5' RNA ligase
VSDPGPAFLALDPGAWLGGAIQAAKDEVRALAGSQRYLEDPPHLTLFVGVFTDRSAVPAVLAGAVPEAPSIGVQGWHVFRDDPLTGGHTLVAALDPAGMAPLRRLQAAALATVAPLRDLRASRDRYAAVHDRLSPVRQASLDRHGFPFTGDDWHPHVSVASIAALAWDPVWSALAARAPHGTARMPALVWYALDGDRPRRLAEVPLP